METLKNVFKYNWHIIAVTLMLVICSEVLMGIMNYNLDPAGFDAVSFFLDMALRIAALIGGTCFTFFLGGIFNHEASGIFALSITVLTVLYSDMIFFYQTDYNVYRICFTVALLLLSFYYINNCGQSLLHTIFYYIMITALAVASLGEIEFFIVLSAAVVTFATKWMLVKSNGATAVNIIFSVLAVIAMVCMFVYKMDDYLGIALVEGPTYHTEVVLLTLKPFGTSKYFSLIENAPSAYNLAKIFGYFGKGAGIVMCVIIVMFAVMTFVVCFESSKFQRPADIIAAIMISVRCFAGIFENFTIVTGTNAGIPILSDGVTGYLIIGLLLGMMITSRERLNNMKGIYKYLLKEFVKDAECDFEEEENV